MIKSDPGVIIATSIQTGTLVTRDVDFGDSGHSQPVSGISRQLRKDRPILRFTKSPAASATGFFAICYMDFPAFRISRI
ncbi:hypothetical protein CU663_25535 [Pseudomonas syringae pv. actinidifoliorum]|nr:hypothetical protein [Pseudomonas syringae pv. actinidifoliorum]